MINILIADDHSVVRKGIKQILSEESDLQVLGEASNNDEIISQLNDKNWDLIILDITMPGKSGLDSIIEMVRCHSLLYQFLLSVGLRRLSCTKPYKDRMPQPSSRFSFKVLHNGG